MSVPEDGPCFVLVRVVLPRALLACVRTSHRVVFNFQYSVLLNRPTFIYDYKQGETREISNMDF